MSKTSITIFYADDDPDDREFLQEALRDYHADIELITCNNGAEAIHYFSNLLPFESLPCLIILDQNMPLVGGKEVLQRLRTIPRVKDIPVVLFTTSSLEEDKLFAQEYDAGFITKPIYARQMENIVDQFIDHCTDDIKTLLRPQVK